MKVRFTARASADLHEIYAEIFEHSPPGAQKIRQAIKTTVSVIGQGRRRSQDTDAPDVRRVAVPHYRYAVYFRLRNDEAQILHIRHSSRQSPDPDEFA